MPSSDVDASPVGQRTSHVLVGERIAEDQAEPAPGAAPGRRDGPEADGEVSVLVVDDQETVRGVVCDVVRSTEGFHLVGLAASGEAALAAAAELSPRLVIMDLRMPGMDGLEASRILTARHPGTVVLLVSVDTPDPEVLGSSAVAAFLPKQRLSPQGLRDMWRDHGS